MATRRALIIVPLYDGSWLPPVPGGVLLVERLKECLKKQGNYDVQALITIIDQKKFRQAIRQFFLSEGDLLFYFYGHGCLRPPGLGVFATSDASPDDEGILMSEVATWAHSSPAREVVLILDCCHAGAATPAARSTFEGLAQQLALNEGRAILAACSSHQEGWVVASEDQNQLGAFSYHILEGLEGKARRRGGATVRASVLGAYITEVFQSWDQNPVIQTSETGNRSCVITFGFPPDAEPIFDTNDNTASLIIGVPFKPSHLFEGRLAELNFLREMLLDARKPVAISAALEGLGGVGKTEIVLQLLCDPEILKRYRTVIWLDGAGPLPPQWEKVARELGLKDLPENAEDLISQVGRKLVDRGSALLILDNASEWRSVSMCIPPNVPLLVTTRARDFGGNSFIHSELGVLSDESATHFLIRVVPELRHDPALPGLVKELAGHALALEIAGWNIKYMGISADDYMERLERHLSDFPSAVSATRYGTPVDACLALTWNALKWDASRTLWRRASLFAPTSAHRDLLRVSFVGDARSREEMMYMMRRSPEFEAISPSLFSDDPSSFTEAYAELRAFHVLARVEGYNGERWAMHRLLRDFGRARLQRGEVLSHALALSEWLINPTLPVASEVPHLVTAIIDSARHVGEFEGRGGSRAASRELYLRSHSSTPILFDSGYFIAYLKDELRDPRALTIILEGLSDINEDVRIQSIRLLENIGPTPEVLEGLAASLDDPDPRVREQAGWTLSEYGGTKTVNILDIAMRGDKPRARLTAVRALGLMNEKAYGVLRDALRSDDARVQIEAALILCEHEQYDGIQIVLDAVLTAPEYDLRRYMEVFKEAGIEIPQELHLKVLKHDDWVIRQDAAIALGKARSVMAVPALIEALGDGDYDVRREASIALGLIGDSAAILPLSKAMRNDHRDDVKMAAARSISVLALSANNVLLAKNKKSQERSAFAAILGDTKAREILPVLIDYLADKNRKVRQEASKAMAKIGDSNMLPHLVNTMKNDPNKEVKMEATISALILGGYTEAADWDVRGRLVEIGRSSDNEYVKTAAAAAIMYFHDSEKGENGNCIIDKKFEEQFGDRLWLLAAIVWIGVGAVEYSAKYKLAKKIVEEVKKSDANSGFSILAQTFGVNDVAELQKQLFEFLLRLVVSQKLEISVGFFVDFIHLKKSENRISATMALGVLGDVMAVPTLVEALSDEDESVRREIVRSLGLLGGSEAKSRLAELAQNDLDSHVRKLATEALDNI